VTDEQISVEVAFALPEHQAIVPLQVPAGTTALEAAKRSNIVEQFPGLVLDEGSRLGIFGHVVAGTQAAAPWRPGGNLSAVAGRPEGGAQGPCRKGQGAAFG
jgi:hypothetical protein